MKTFVEVLADKLEGALPGRVLVERKSVRFFAKEKRVDRIECQLGDARYVLSTRNGLEVRRAKAVRGVVLKTEELSFDEWLGALAQALADEARTSEQARLALEQLLAG